jgi:hypothetical protein
MFPDLGASHAEDRAVEIDILATSELRMETGTDLEQACDASSENHPARCLLGDAAHDLKKRALAGSTAPDDSQHFAALELEADIL